MIFSDGHETMVFGDDLEDKLRSLAREDERDAFGELNFLINREKIRREIVLEELKIKQKLLEQNMSIRGSIQQAMKTCNRVV